MARAQLRELVARLRAAVGTEAPDDDEIAALVDEVRAERACQACVSSLIPTFSSRA